MRVVFMSATHQVWGAEVSLLTLAAALKARGVEVAVVCFAGELADSARADGHEVFVAGANREGRRVSMAGRLWREYIAHMRPGDRLVLFSYILVAWAPLFRRRLIAQGVRISLDLHDQLESRKAFWSVKLASEAVDTVIACSAFTAAQMGGRENVYALHRPVVADGRIGQAAARQPRAVGSAAASHPHPVGAARLADEPAAVAAGVAASAYRAESQRHGEHVARAARSGAVQGSISKPSHGDRSLGSATRREVAAGRHGSTRSSTFGAAADADGHPPEIAADRGGDRVVGVPCPDDPGTSARPFRVGIVGRISKEKRHELVIEALSGLDREVELVVRGSAFGDSHDYAACVDEKGERLLAGRFVNEGRVPAAEALTGLDAVVVGNPAEPMGRTVLEAQLRGVVPVVPDSGGSCELVEDGRTGLIYRAEDADDLARALLRVIDEPALAAAIARDAPPTVPQPAEYAAAYLSRLG